MSDAASSERSIIEWGTAGSAIDGVSGDLPVVAHFAGGVLIALADGLGHGPEAAAAASELAPVLAEHAAEPVLQLLRRGHEALRKTRGAVLSVASIDVRQATVTAAGVGNVEVVLLRAQSNPPRRSEAIGLRPGVLGFQLPPLREDRYAIVPGDVLVLATDGVRSGFSTGLPLDRPAQEIAESVLARYAKGTDDAQVLVARYLGEVP